MSASDLAINQRAKSPNDDWAELTGSVRAPAQHGFLKHVHKVIGLVGMCRSRDLVMERQLAEAERV